MVSLGENIYPIDSELAKKIGSLAHIGNEIKGVPFFLLIIGLIWHPPAFIWRLTKKLLQNIGLASYMRGSGEHSCISGARFEPRFGYYISDCPNKIV